jgi:hypothetical protein
VEVPVPTRVGGKGETYGEEVVEMTTPGEHRVRKWHGWVGTQRGKVVPFNGDLWRPEGGWGL